MKRLLTLALGATFALTAFGELDHIDLRGVDYTVDTLFHAKIGPGTTQTQLRLEGPNPLNVFYLTVDVSTPGVSIRTVSGTDKVAGTSRTSPWPSPIPRKACCILQAPTVISIGPAAQPPTARRRSEHPPARVPLKMRSIQPTISGINLYTT